MGTEGVVLPARMFERWGWEIPIFRASSVCVVGFVAFITDKHNEALKSVKSLIPKPLYQGRKIGIT